KSLSSIQWALFILMTSVIVPITLSELFNLSIMDTIQFIQRSLFILGLAGILQALFGHRLPVQEGPTNLWCAIFIIFSTCGPTLFSSQEEIFSILQFAMLASGVLFIILTLMKGMEFIEKFMTSTLLAVYLLLLVVQLAESFLGGLLGISEASETINVKILILSAILIAINYFVMTLRGINIYSVLI